MIEKERNESKKVAVIQQLSLFEHPAKDSFYPIVVNALKKYPKRKNAVQNLRKRIESEFFLPEEKRNELEEKLQFYSNWVQSVEHALESLTPERRRIIELYYFSPEKPLDVAVMQKVHMKSTKYYKEKEAAIRDIATILCLI